MTTTKKQQAKKWIDEASHHLALLWAEAVECADEDDVIPTEAEKENALALMKELEHSRVPTMGITVNGEIALTWESTRDSFKAYARPDGSMRFYQNKKPVDRQTFTELLTAVPA